MQKSIGLAIYILSFLYLNNFSEKAQAKGHRPSLINKGLFLFSCSHPSIHPLHPLEKWPSQFYCSNI